jgi:hypothetical protein
MTVEDTKSYFLAGSVLVVKKSFLEIEHCMFYGLGFVPMWVGAFTI